VYFYFGDVVFHCFRQTSTFGTDLKVGSSGSDVINLQTWLISKGFDIPAISSGISGKGYFGSQTKIAVAKYQPQLACLILVMSDLSRVEN